MGISKAALENQHVSHMFAGVGFSGMMRLCEVRCVSHHILRLARHGHVNNGKHVCFRQEMLLMSFKVGLRQSCTGFQFL